MDIFDILNLVGGIALFLFGMDLMGQGLERRAGSSLRLLIARLTTNKLTGLMTGIAVTALIQSSAATTVMVVGFVNSGLMTLRQAISVIMGANIGTTVTAWILSLAGIEGSNIFIQLLKPSSFTPLLAFIGIILYMYNKKNEKRRETGLILLGFATLMFGMQTMTGSVSGLSEIPEVGQFLILFKNPVLGLIAGALLTAAIQSSSASVGILQALTSTGSVTYQIAVPIIMGQNIGTCITAILSSFGTNKNAKRAAVCHLFFNIIGSAVWLSIFCIISFTLNPALLSSEASMAGIAVTHTIFNVLCVCLMLPLSGLLERIAYVVVPDTDKPDTITKLDERLLSTPSLALAQCRNQLIRMSTHSMNAMTMGLEVLFQYDEDEIAQIHELEEKTDTYEDLLNNYLVKLSSRRLSVHDSAIAAEYLKLIGDYERIADYGYDLALSAEELHSKEMEFSQDAYADLGVIFDAIREISELTQRAFKNNDMEATLSVEPLGQHIEVLKEDIRSRHIERLQRGECTAEAGFMITDILTDLDRAAHHCSNIAAYILEGSNNKLDMHTTLRTLRNDDEEFKRKFREYQEKYSLSS